MPEGSDHSRRTICPDRIRLMAVNVTALLGGAVWSGHLQAESILLKEGPGRDLTAASCTVCHSLDYIVNNGQVMTPAHWQASVRKMIDVMGAPIDAPTSEAILAYLSKNYVAPSTK